jgi:hypothetical protein
MKFIGSLIGGVVGKKRGEYTLLHKRLFVPSNESATMQIDDIVQESKDRNIGVIMNANILGEQVTVGNPKTASGEWIDFVQVFYRIKDELQVAIANLLMNTPKIPATKQGKDTIAIVVQTTLEAIGVLYNVKVDTTDMIVDSNRTFSGLRFSAIYDGAINSVEIRGEVSA